MLSVVRIRAMLDVLTNRVSEKYPWGAEGTGESVKQSSASLHHQLTQFQLKRREQINRAKSTSQAVYDQSLYYLKEGEWGALTAESAKRPFVGLSCNECTPSSRVSVCFGVLGYLQGFNPHPATILQDFLCFT